jgi:hypothetical protein
VRRAWYCLDLWGKKMDNLLDLMYDTDAEADADARL